MSTHSNCCSHNDEPKHAHGDGHNEDHDHGHDHSHGSAETLGEWFVINKGMILSSILFLIGLLLDVLAVHWFEGPIRISVYILSYSLVSFPIFKDAISEIKKGDLFSEFSLMGIATLGAIAIGEYPEGVAVMLFYALGEMFQGHAVSKAKANIKSLLDLRPNSAHVYRDGSFTEVNSKEIQIGELLQIRNGESVALDGVLESEKAELNTAALTGESVPRDFLKGQKVLSGMINQGAVIQVKVEKLYDNSSISKILEMVQTASSKKAKTELFIRKFAKIYTPIVFFLALAIALVPALFITNYIFVDWLYKGLVFLVISCPCALVISIPLGYFGGIGAASKNGILFKGSNFIDAMTKVTHVVMDKTGTLTTGEFQVQDVQSEGLDKNQFLKMIGAVESQSTHPIANAITSYVLKHVQFDHLSKVEEISGHGLKSVIDGQVVLVGNQKLLKKFGVTSPDLSHVDGSVVVVAVDGRYAGYVNVADRIKEDSKLTVDLLRKHKIKSIMLSGDKIDVVEKVAKTLGVDQAFGDLLPENKVKKVEALKKDKNSTVAFVGDGINDAPVLALSDIGIAMGAMGSDAAIETADVVLQDDRPLNIVKSIAISKATRRIVIQNICLAFGVKAIVLMLGAGGLATMWEAVFADVGVALLAIFNAIRIQRYKF